MKGKIIKKFRDKITRSVYAAGDTIERDEARIAEINKAEGGPFIVVIDDTGAESENEAPAAKAEGENEAAVPKAEAASAAEEAPGGKNRSKKAKE